MPRFRYEATDQRGVPVHGTADADNDAALSETLSNRGLRLVSSSELSLDALIGAHQETLPRLYQLRVGEQLREALVSGLPAHEAVRSVAAEPLSHPMLGMAPWLQVVSSILFAATLAVWWLTGDALRITVAAGVVAIVVVPLIWFVLYRVYCRRPKQLLRLFADRIEAGESLPAQLSLAIPSELRSVMQSEVDDAGKARVAADLVPCLLGTSLKTQQFVMATIGPLAMLGVMLMVMYSGLLFIIPQFKEIFEGFGVELPSMTVMVISLSDMVAFFGVGGWLLLIVLGCGFLILAAVAMVTGTVTETLSRTPLFGMAFRWAMQARVARILAAMLRNDCNSAESLRTATAGSGFRSVRAMGETMATELETGSPTLTRTPLLSGLPVSMLTVTDTGLSDHERRSGIARTFQSLSEMLDAATLSQGQLFSIVVQFLTLIIGTVAVGFTVLAMFLPLIKLLNDLS